MKQTISDLDLYGYSAKVTRLSSADGGGWMAEIPQLDGCFSDGDTPEDAIHNLNDVVRLVLEVAKQDGKALPEPETRIPNEYSGKFTLRLPRSLHRYLADRAENEGVSLNQYILSLISFEEGRKATYSPLSRL